MTSGGVDVLGTYSADCGEGPAWDPAAGALVWVDITGHEIHLTATDGSSLQRIPTGQDVGAALPIEGSRWLAVLEREVVVLSSYGRSAPLAALDVDGSIRFNDAKCDAAGRVLVGTMAYDQTPGAGELYRLNGSALVPLVTGLGLSNGLDWSPDGRMFYHVDSGPGTVTAWTYGHDGTLTDPRVIIEVHGPGLLPDGMCVDDEGCLWLAVWGAGEVRRHSPDGRLLSTWPVPASQVTSCAFGGSDGKTLFVTSARYQLSEEQLEREPHAGALFAIDPGCSGPHATPWRPAS